MTKTIMKNILTFLIVFVCSFNSLSQQDTTIVRVGLTKSELLKVKSDYVKMMLCETYIAMRSSTEDMIDKVNGNITKSLINEKDWIVWITENLSKTKFKDIDEAVILRKKGIELTKKQFEEHRQIYKMLEKASLEQLSEVLRAERSTPF